MKKFFSKHKFFFWAIIIFLFFACAVQLFLPKKQFDASKFQIIENYPSNYQIDTSPLLNPTFVFSQKLAVDEKNLGNYFHITPTIPGTWHLGKNGQIVFFSKNISSVLFAYNTIYKITIDKSLPSDFKKTLGENFSYTFKTKQNPQFAVEVQKKLMNILPGEPITVPINQSEHTNLFPTIPLHVTVALATKDQLLNYFIYNLPLTDGNNSFYQLEPNTNNQILFSFDAIIQKNSSGFGGNFSLPPIVTPGLYVVTISNNFGSDNFFLLVTSTITQLFTDKKTYYTWTTDGSGNYLPNVTSSFYSLKNNVTLQGTQTSNNQGITNLQTTPKNVDLVISQSGPNITIVSTNPFLFESDINLNQAYSVFSINNKSNTFLINLSANKQAYKPGENAAIEASATFPVSNALTVATVYGNTKQNFYAIPSTIASVIATPVNWNSWSFSFPIKETFGKSIGLDVYTVYQQTIITKHLDLPINNSKN